MTVDALNRMLRAGRARAEQLEGKLADVVERVLLWAGEDAVRSFTSRTLAHMTAAAPGLTSGSAMVAVYPRSEEATRLAVDGGEEAGVLHVTLAFLGEPDDDTVQAAVEAVRSAAGSLAPLTGVVGGVGAFGAAEGDPAPQIALPDVPGLAELRHAVVTALAHAGVDFARNHGWCPHLTLGYVSEPAMPNAAAVGTPLHFDAVTVARGNEAVAVVPLTGPPALTAAGTVEELELAHADVREAQDDLLRALRAHDDAAVKAGKAALKAARARLAAAAGAPGWTPPAAPEVVDVEALVRSLRGKTDPVRRAVAETMAKSAVESVGLTFDVDNPFVARVLEQSASQVVNIAESTRAQVMRTISEAYQQGLSIPEAAKAIRIVMLEASRTRAEAIAITELAGATNGGALAATQIVERATGQKMWKQWITAPGARWPRHEEYSGLDGQTVGLDELFTVGTSRMQYPADPTGAAHDVIRCRCDMVMVDTPPS